MIFQEVQKRVTIFEMERQTHDYLSRKPTERATLNNVVSPKEEGNRKVLLGSSNCGDPDHIKQSCTKCRCCKLQSHALEQCPILARRKKQINSLS